MALVTLIVKDDTNFGDGLLTRGMVREPAGSSAAIADFSKRLTVVCVCAFSDTGMLR